MSLRKDSWATREMSTVNDELPQASPTSSSKGRLTSPLEFRNTDLICRLLAATPPYLYNMPSLPHRFFFSEMLRSFVQKSAVEHHQIHNNVQLPNGLPPRPDLLNNNSINLPKRQRKRLWSSCSNKRDVWLPKEGDDVVDERVSRDTWSTDAFKHSKFDDKLEHRHKISELIDAKENDEKPEIRESADTRAAQPLWYPPLYPVPMDPLNFFMDLRVRAAANAAHIFDAQNRTKESVNLTAPSEENNVDSANSCNSGNAIENGVETNEADNKSINASHPRAINGNQASFLFKNGGNYSAFRVPAGKTYPMNLSKIKENEQVINVGYVCRNLNRVYGMIHRVSNSTILNENDETESEKDSVDMTSEDIEVNVDDDAVDDMRSCSRADSNSESFN